MLKLEVSNENEYRAPINNLLKQISLVISKMRVFGLLSSLNHLKLPMIVIDRAYLIHWDYVILAILKFISIVFTFTSPELLAPELLVLIVVKKLIENFNEKLNIDLVYKEVEKFTEVGDLIENNYLSLFYFRIIKGDKHSRHRFNT